MKVGCLFSGGKDSNMALFLSKSQGYNIKCLITLKSLNPDSYMFHTTNIDLINKQAQALNLPLIFIKTKGKKEKELLDLKKAIKKAKEKYKIQTIVSGAFASEYQKTRIDQICQELNLKSFAPLWHKNPETLMKDMLKAGFEIIIISISAEGLDKSFLGKKIDKNLFKKLKKLKIHIAGEGGCYESFVLNGPNYNKKLKIIKAEKIMENEYTGKYLIKELKII